MTGRMVLPLRMAALVLAALATVVAPPGSLAAQAAPLQGLDAYVEKGIQDWEIPGLALAVVKDGEVIHMRGYGVKSLDTGEPVDENTLFAIGSASKAFTASAVAMLRDEGLLEWDDPANEHLPSLELFDPWATRQLTVRDILTHRSGLSRGDAVWYSTDFDRDEILRRIRYLEPSWGFREQFGYQNLMYLAAGQLVPALTGTSWDAFVEERIFEPLGMERSNTSADSLEGMRNVAAPHSWIDGEVGTIPYKNIDNIGPAGSINSSVAEMVNWLRLHLSDGTFQGQQILSEDAVEEMQTPQMLLRLEGRWRGMSPTSHFMTYGMGWFLNDHHGRLVVQHGGNIDGMHALVGMMPEEDVGLVVLTNITPNYLSYSLMYRVFDAILGEEPVDWSGQLLEWYRDLQAGGGGEAERVTGTSPSRALDHYAGTYEHPMFGRVVVEARNGGLHVTQENNVSSRVEHWHFDTFRVHWAPPRRGSSLVNFSLNAQGDVARLQLQGMGEYERVPEDS